MGYRLDWTNEQREEFFFLLQKNYPLKWSAFAREIGVHPRSLCDWRLGKTHMPVEILNNLMGKFSVELRQPFSIVNESVYRSKAGKIGAQARMVKHGQLGTNEGRRRGGINAMKALQGKGNNFIFAKMINYPRLNSELAEFIGIMIGDGNISPYQLQITGCESTDSSYKHYVQELGLSLFGIPGAISMRKDKDCWNVTFSSVLAVKYLLSLGLPMGDKIKNNVDIPGSIINSSLVVDCLRGMFDTDGCIFLDKHTIKEKKYYHMGLAYTIYAQRLLDSTYQALKSLGFSPTISIRRNLLIRKQEEVKRFFSEVVPRNEKHWRRYQEFLHIRGEVG